MQSRSSLLVLSVLMVMLLFVCTTAIVVTVMHKEPNLYQKQNALLEQRILIFK